MSYIGNTSSVQQYAPQIAYFSGDASTVAFTLPVSVVSAAQIIVTVANVIQNPSSAFTVSGTTLTFTSAPPSGTNNIWVQYTTLQTSLVTPAASSVGLTQLSASGTASSSTYLRGDNSWASINQSQWTTTGSNISYTAGTVGIGVAANSGTPLTIGRVNSSAEGGQIDLCRSSDNASSWAIDVYGDTSTPSLRFIDNIAAANRMQIDGSGRVTKPYQPAFFAYKSVTFSGTSQTPFQFTDVDLNIGSHYSNSTYRFTAPIAGRYYFSSALAVYLNGSARQVSMGIRKNGSLYCMSDCHITVTQSNNTHGVANLSIIMELAANDYVDVQWEGATATVNVYVDSRRCYFSGYLLG